MTNHNLQDKDILFLNRLATLLNENPSVTYSALNRINPDGSGIGFSIGSTLTRIGRPVIVWQDYTGNSTGGSGKPDGRNKLGDKVLNSLTMPVNGLQPNP